MNAEEEWQDVEVTIDSGAIDSVMHRSHVESVPTKKTRRTGTPYRVANGQRIYNEAEKKLHVKTEEGSEGNMTFQITDVKKPLAAVGKINQGGSGVWLDLEERGGSYIQNMATGKRTKIRMKNGAFTLRLKVKKGPRGTVNFVGLEEAI